MCSGMRMYFYHQIYDLLIINISNYILNYILNSNLNYIMIFYIIFYLIISIFIIYSLLYLNFVYITSPEKDFHTYTDLAKNIIKISVV